MKIMHISDLHLGKTLNEYSLSEDQRYILKKIVGIASDEKPDAFIIAGDIYDKPSPTAEAVAMFDDFLYELSLLESPVLIVSGNHDSAERLSFASRIIDRSGIHISPVYNGDVKPVVISDGKEDAYFWLLPFIRPIHVRSVFPDENALTYTEALKAAVSRMDIDEGKINVLVAHQFVTGGKTSDSEIRYSGGLDEVSASVFEKFDFVALGHLHRPQSVSDKIRYSGSPLKYSLSEADTDKSVTIAEITEKRSGVKIREVPLEPLHGLYAVEGSFDGLIGAEGTVSDYVYIRLTDRGCIPDAARRLKSRFTNIVSLTYESTEPEKTVRGGISASEVKTMNDEDIFAGFYELMNNEPISEEMTGIVREIFGKIKEERV